MDENSRNRCSLWKLHGKKTDTEISSESELVGVSGTMTKLFSHKTFWSHKDMD